METLIENDVINWEIDGAFQIEGNNYGSLEVYISEICCRNTNVFKKFDCT